jgi:hypothetical protein
MGHVNLLVARKGKEASQGRESERGGVGKSFSLPHYFLGHPANLLRQEFERRLFLCLKKIIFFFKLIIFSIFKLLF